MRSTRKELYAMKKINIKLTYIDELLGTCSANPELHAEFIASKAPDHASREEEVAAIGVEEAIDKAMTVFPKMDDGTPFLWDYQSKTRKAYKKEIDGLVFVMPRRIPLVMPDGGQVGSCQRPLRASTAQGERVALANSETVPEGTTQTFSVTVLRDGLMPLVKEWLDYGALHGTGQWRNAGKGRFVYTAYDEDGVKLFGTE